MIKKIFCDVDGTLCASDGTISQRTIDSINVLKASGIDFVLSTGRSYCGLKKVFEQYGAPLSCICDLGSDYYNDKGELCLDLPLCKEAVFAIHRIAKQCPNQGLAIFTAHKQMCDIPVERFLQQTFNISSLKGNSPMDEWFCNLHYCDDPQQYLKTPIYKMEFHTDTEEQCCVLMEQLKKVEGINPCLSEPKNIEISSCNASKGELIRRICALEDISLDEVLTIGDSFNDLSMLQGFKYSVAMGNAPEALKQLCNYVSDDNNHDGVAKVIEQVMNGYFNH